jgi:hypothetical protein
MNNYFNVYIGHEIKNYFNFLYNAVGIATGYGLDD